MTAKYFYRCPIEADYMCKNFGMKFPSMKKDKYYINQKSLKLLEPQIGDLVKFDWPENYFYVCDNSDPKIPADQWPPPGCETIQEVLDMKSDPEGFGQCYIIQRNHKPFFWPEKEKL
ncbi:MAG: hypothetical protein AB7F19_07650 [Candidatus Babeliales bacterium]